MIVTAMTGFLLEVIGLWTGSLMPGMAEKGLVGMEAQGVAWIDLEAEGPPVMKDEVIGTNLALMTAREGEVILLMTVTKALVASVIPSVDSCLFSHLLLRHFYSSSLQFSYWK